jgi:hypothetical protein
VATIEDAIGAKLAATSGVTDLTSTRIYAMHLPQRPTLPAITYRKISGVRIHAMSADPGVAHPRFQVDSWGKTYESAKDVEVQVRAALSRWRGDQSGVTILASFVENEIDLFEDETGDYRIITDFVIWHRE